MKSTQNESATMIGMITAPSPRSRSIIRHNNNITSDRSTIALPAWVPSLVPLATSQTRNRSKIVTGTLTEVETLAARSLVSTILTSATRSLRSRRASTASTMRPFNVFRLTLTSCLHDLRKNIYSKPACLKITAKNQ